MKKLFSSMKWALAVLVLVVIGVSLHSNRAMAEGYGLTIAPMNQSVVIDPGDSREASFRISNPSSSPETVLFTISVKRFYLSYKGESVYEANGNSGLMVDWISFDGPTEDTLMPNEVKEITFTIDVPENAPAGGQYVSIFLTPKGENDDDGANGGRNNTSQANITEIKRMGHLVYAEITGDIRRAGEIKELNVPSFLFSGNISGSALITNTGNTHSTASYKIQVFPLFSDEAIYTNAEEPRTRVILPERSWYETIEWGQTPSIGIFNVVYTVEFQDMVKQVKKMVIICPLWLLFIVVFLFLVIVMI